MLAGADLVKARHRVASSDKSLPLKGPKEFQPNGSWLESKQVQSQLDERKALLDTHRVEKQQRLSTAEWHRDLGLGLVVRRVGDWESFGYESGCKLWIYPEEALYLLETNCIELLFDDVPMSIEQGYATLLAPNSSCSLEQYRTFSHLKCNGYHVRKHSPELTFTRYERQLRLDQYTVKSCFKAPKTIDPMERRTSLEVEIKEQDVIRVEEIPEMLMEEDEPPPKETDTEGKQVVAEMDPSMAEKETELPSSESINEDIVKDYESNSSSNNVVESEVSLNESDSKKELETSEPMDISLDTTPSTTAIDSSGVRVAEDSLTKDREKEEEPKSMTETREEPPSNQDDSRKQTELDSITGKPNSSSVTVRTHIVSGYQVSMVPRASLAARILVEGSPFNEDGADGKLIDSSPLSVLSDTTPPDDETPGNKTVPLNSGNTLASMNEFVLTSVDNSDSLARVSTEFLVVEEKASKQIIPDSGGTKHKETLALDVTARHFDSPKEPSIIDITNQNVGFAKVPNLEKEITAIIPLKDNSFVKEMNTWTSESVEQNMLFDDVLEDLVSSDDDSSLGVADKRQTTEDEEARPVSRNKVSDDVPSQQVLEHIVETMNSDNYEVKQFVSEDAGGCESNRPSSKHRSERLVEFLQSPADVLDSSLTPDVYATDDVDNLTTCYEVDPKSNDEFIDYSSLRVNPRLINANDPLANVDLRNKESEQSNQPYSSEIANDLLETADDEKPFNKYSNKRLSDLGDLTETSKKRKLEAESVEFNECEEMMEPVVDLDLEDLEVSEPDFTEQRGIDSCDFLESLDIGNSHTLSGRPLSPYDQDMGVMSVGSSEAPDLDDLADGFENALVSPTIVVDHTEAVKLSHSDSALLLNDCVLTTVTDQTKSSSSIDIINLSKPILSQTENVNTVITNQCEQNPSDFLTSNSIVSANDGATSIVVDQTEYLAKLSNSVASVNEGAYITVANQMKSDEIIQISFSSYVSENNDVHVNTNQTNLISNVNVSNSDASNIEDSIRNADQTKSNEMINLSQSASSDNGVVLSLANQGAPLQSKAFSGNKVNLLENNLSINIKGSQATVDKTIIQGKAFSDDNVNILENNLSINKVIQATVDTTILQSKAFSDYNVNILENNLSISKEIHATVEKTIHQNKAFSDDVNILENNLSINKDAQATVDKTFLQNKAYSDDNVNILENNLRISKEIHATVDKTILQSKAFSDENVNILENNLSINKEIHATIDLSIPGEDGDANATAGESGDVTRHYVSEGTDVTRSSHEAVDLSSSSVSINTSSVELLSSTEGNETLHEVHDIGDSDEDEEEEDEEDEDSDGGSSVICLSGDEECTVMIPEELEIDEEEEEEEDEEEEEEEDSDCMEVSMEEEDSGGRKRRRESSPSEAGPAPKRRLIETVELSDDEVEIVEPTPPAPRPPRSPSTWNEALLADTERTRILDSIVNVVNKFSVKVCLPSDEFLPPGVRPIKCENHLVLSALNTVGLGGKPHRHYRPAYETVREKEGGIPERFCRDILAAGYPGHMVPAVWAQLDPADRARYLEASEGPVYPLDHPRFHPHDHRPPPPRPPPRPYFPRRTLCGVVPVRKPLPRPRTQGGGWFQANNWHSAPPPPRDDVYYTPPVKIKRESKQGIVVPAWHVNGVKQEDVKPLLAPIKLEVQKSMVRMEGLEQAREEPLVPRERLEEAARRLLLHTGSQRVHSSTQNNTTVYLSRDPGEIVFLMSQRGLNRLHNKLGLDTVRLSKKKKRTQRAHAKVYLELLLAELRADPNSPYGAGVCAIKREPGADTAPVSLMVPRVISFLNRAMASTPGVGNDTTHVVEETLRVVEVTPRAVEVTPRVVEETPRVIEATPQINEVTTHIVEETPRVVDETPRVVEVTPRVVEVTPQINEVTTHIVEETPRVVDETPRVVEVTPRVVEETPRVIEATPQINEVTTHIVEETPRVIEATPQINEVTTHIVEETPRVVDETPRVVEVTPRVVEATPQINEVTTHVVEETPRVVDKTPRVVEVTPRLVEDTPRVVEDTPPRVEETPRVVEVTPRVVLVTPQINEITTHVVEETPRVVEVTPRVVLVTPQINEVTAHAIEETLRLVEVTPRVNEDTTQVSEVMSRVSKDMTQVSEDTTEVSEDTSRVSEDTSQFSEDIGRVSKDSTEVSEDTTQVSNDITEVREDNMTQVSEDEVSKDMTQISEDMGLVSEDVAQVSKDITDVSEDTTRVSQDTTWVSNDMSLVSEDMTQVSKDITDVIEDTTRVSENTTRVSNDMPKVSEDMTQVSEDITEVSKDMTQISEDMSLVSEDMTQVSKDITDVSEDITAVSEATTQISKDMTHVEESRIPKRTEPAEGEVEPLLRPADCTTIGNILSRLAIIKPANLEALEVVSHERKLSITYDLYLPNTLFRKATPCLPNFRIIVLRGEEPIPEPGEIASLLQRYQDQVQLLYAVVQPCSVNFYLLSQVHLPPIPFDVAKLHS